MIFHQLHNSAGGYHYNAFFYTDEQWNFHFHKNPELIYVVKGAVNCTVQNAPYRLTEGEFGLCLPYDIHAYTPEPDTRYWVGVFSEDYVRSFSKQVDGKSAHGFRFTCPPAVRSMLLTELIAEQPPSVYMLKACLYAVCDAYCRAVPLSVDASPQKQTVRKIADYIAENHTGNISLADIASLLGYDYHYVSRYFHSVLNMPFKDFLNLYRLETAVELLDETDKKITEIAMASGFQSVRSFNHSFRSYFGVSPSDYRKSPKSFKKKEIVPFFAEDESTSRG